MVSSVSGNQAFNFESLNGQTKAKESSAEEIQNRFLKLLTTQLKTQDPSNPMDNAQMTSQMAQISTVSSLEAVNQSIKSLTDNQAASQSLMATLMIGRTALIPSTEMKVSGSQGQMVLDLAEAAGEVQVTITNQAGTVVNEMKLGSRPAGQLTLSWDGKNAQGTLQPDGQYKVSVRAVNGNTAVENSLLSPAKINSVAISAGVASLVLESGKKMSLSEVTQIV